MSAPGPDVAGKALSHAAARHADEAQAQRTAVVIPGQTHAPQASVVPATALPPATIKGGAHQAMQHDSARKHVTGEAPYIDDLPEWPGTLHVALAGSPQPCGRVTRLDLSIARAMPGVHAILTGKTFKGVNDIAPILSGEPALAIDEVQWLGHPVAAVAADNLDQARAAAKAIEVEIEPLAPVLSIDEALAREDYVCKPQRIVRGDAGQAIKAAAQVFDGRLDIGGQDHFYLEGQIAYAIPGEDHDMRVLSSTQHPSEVQHGVAHVLGVPFNAVTVECRRMGGAFGGKESQATIIAAIAAALAERTGRPVKLRLPRDDDMIMTGKRHDMQVDYTVGVDAGGRLQAVAMRFAARAGNVADLSGPVITRALCHADNCYDLPNADLRGFACRTNTVSNTAFRGFGGPQGMLAIECLLDDTARRLGLGLDELRARNYYGPETGEITPYGQVVEDNQIARMVGELADRADLAARRAEIAAFNATSPVLKRGLATMPIKFGISFNLPTLNQAGALVHVYTDGSVHLNHGGTEMGQGLFVKVGQVVAEGFQIDLDNVKISATATDKVPNTSATAASSGSDLNGKAALAAVQTIRARMNAVAARHFAVDERALEWRGGRIYAGNEAITFADLAQKCWAERVSLSATGYYQTPKIHWDPVTMTGRPFFYYTYGAAAAEVIIDTLTGENRCLRVDIVQDCGTSLNPAIDLGQIEGGFVQGMGWLTSEELVWDDRGALRTHGPSTYKIPGSRDVPPVFNVHIVPDLPNREDTIFRSKAIGEPPLMLAISVFLAIRDALGTIAPPRTAIPLQAPATPEAVLMAVEKLQSLGAK